LQGRSVRPGDLALLDLSVQGSEARVVRVLGRPDVARDVIAGLMLDRGLPGSFPEGVEGEAQAAARRVARARAPRRDLRGLPTFTIDPLSARDFDDAVSAEELPGGRTRVWVHIADVAAHVRPGSALDGEARRRGTSVYVAGMVEPMLPHALSSDACSLLPGRDRPAVTVELEIAEGGVIGASFYRSLIRSDERLDYERVDRIFAGRERPQEPWALPLAAARAAASGLQRRRERLGGLVVESLEPEFEFDERGDVAAIHAREQTESHRLIEHLMIAANEAVAARLSELRIPCLYRVHERPDPDRVVRLVDQLASLEVPTPPLPERMSSTEAAAVVGEASRLVERYVRHSARGRIAFGGLILRTLKQAYYSPVNLGHSGLRSTSYCHFTSPIRRYPDLVCHRALLSTLAADETAPAASGLAQLGTATSDSEREAMQIERDGDDVARCFALERVLREEGRDAGFAGEVAGLIPAGAFIAFGTPAGAIAPPFEGLLPVRMLRAPASVRRGRGRGRDTRGPDERREWWQLNEEGTILYGERSGAAVRMGDPIDVRVARVEAPRGRVDLLPAG
jgi:ribonuclease R